MSQKLQNDQVETRPSRVSPGMDVFQRVKIPGNPQSLPPKVQNFQSANRLGAVILFFVLLVLGYFLFPARSNILILGVDGGLGRGALGRTDTIIVTTILPFFPYIGEVSIPRDLWVEIPGVGENRINTAYFYAEANKEGSGSQAARDVILKNFGVSMDYSVVIRMDGLVELIDAAGGVDVTVPATTSGYPAGDYHFDGAEALKFARSRAGSDDFARMKQGQILSLAFIRKMMNPITWGNLPKIIQTLPGFVQTDLPVWLLPRLGLAVIRGINQIDSYTITREMVNPFTTSGGAQVLLPDWEKINPLMQKVFGK